MKRDEILRYLNGNNDEELFAVADEVRKENVGDTVHIRGIIEFSNHCRRLCKYCGLNALNKSVVRYRMTPDEVKATADKAKELGYRTIVLQSGEDRAYTIDMLAEIVHYIASLGITVTLSTGEMTREEYRILKEAGATRYLLKHETSSPELYAYLHSDSTLDARLKALEYIREFGYEVGGGFLVGLPGQSIGSIADDLLLAKKLKLDMCGIGTFIPHSETPLNGAETGSPLITKRAVALMRILLPQANIPVTTSYKALSGDNNIFSFGANVIMTKLTPEVFADNYDIYPLKRKSEDMETVRRETERLIIEEGRLPL